MSIWKAEHVRVEVPVAERIYQKKNNYGAPFITRLSLLLKLTFIFSTLACGVFLKGRLDQDSSININMTGTVWGYDAYSLSWQLAEKIDTSHISLSKYKAIT